MSAGNELLILLLLQRGGDLKLEIELVPKTAWFTNLRSRLPKPSGMLSERSVMRRPIIDVKSAGVKEQNTLFNAMRSGISETVR